jgi:multiple sugar transport system permease protein
MTYAVSEIRTAGKPRRRRFSHAAVEPWLYLSPAIVLLVVVLLVPLVIGISYSFRKFSAFKSEYVGLGQYEAMLSDQVLGQALLNTLWWTIASLFFQFFLGLGLALLLDKPFWGRKAVQALVFLPWAVPSFLSGLTWAWLFNPIVGPLPHWLFALGLKAEPTNVLSDPSTAMWGPIIANVWFGIPFFAITLLAALKSIPSELHEAAAIDGASPWQRFTKVTLPFLAPTIAITVMLRTIWIATFADLIFVMTRGRAGRVDQHGAGLHLCQCLQVAGQRVCLGGGRAAAHPAHCLCDRADRHTPFHGEARLMIAGRSASQRVFGGIGLYAAIAAYVIFALFPIYWTLKISVTPERLLYSEGITFWPSQTTLQNFVTVLEATDFPRYFLNSVIVSVSTAALVTVIATLAGYAMSRFTFRGKAALALMLLLTQTFPLVMVIPPIYRVMGQIGLINSLTGLIIVYTAFNTPLPPS